MIAIDRRPAAARQSDQAFQFIQEFSGFFTPGITVIFLLGLFWKRATEAGAIAAAVASVVLSWMYWFDWTAHVPALSALGALDSIPFMNRMICCALVVLSAPASAQAQAPAAAKVTIAELARPNSNVSIAVEPTLSDGRLIVRIAVQNHSAAAVALGPGNVSIAKAKGGPIALIPLQRLIEEVDIAAGGPATASHAGSAAYDAPILPVNSEGRVDVSGYTGGTSVAPDERCAGRDRPRPASRPSRVMKRTSRSVCSRPRS